MSGPHLSAVPHGAPSRLGDAACYATSTPTATLTVAGHAATFVAGEFIIGICTDPGTHDVCTATQHA
jgi:hypothetical protein